MLYCLYADSSVQRSQQDESLRKIAAAYGVSHHFIRWLIHVAQEQGE